MTDPLFANTMQPIERVQKGMNVFDPTGERLGEVEYVQMGDARAATSPADRDQTPGFIEAVVEAVTGPEPDVPQPLRSRLLRTGYIKVDGPGLTDRDRYVPAGYIDRIEADRVWLTHTIHDIPREQ